MGRKPNQEKASPEVKPKDDPKIAESKCGQSGCGGCKADEVEDTPIIKELKVIDDKYLELEKQYEKEVCALRRTYEEKYKPVLSERSKLLAEKPAGDDGKTGTPACKGFWLQALKNHPAFEELIQEWDEPVLEFLKDITCEVTAEDDKNFKLCLEFEENDYFDHKVVTLDFKAEEENPYTGEITVKSIKCDPEKITWKSGKDITSEKAVKKAKGGGAKKAKQKGKETVEPRDSFFRRFTVSMTEGEDLPEQISCLPEITDCGADDEEIVEGIMQEVYEASQEVKDRVIPFAVRWYTGEAAPDDDDDDDEESEEEDDDDSESDDEPAPSKKNNKKKGGSPAGGPAAAPKEECKQQ